MSQGLLRSGVILLLILAGTSFASARDGIAAIRHPAHARVTIITTGPGHPACPAGMHVGWFTNFCFPNSTEH